MSSEEIQFEKQIIWLNLIILNNRKIAIDILKTNPTFLKNQKLIVKAMRSYFHETSVF